MHPPSQACPALPAGRSIFFCQASSASKAAPESARGRLKSCLSSRKRSRGGSGNASGSGSSTVGGGEASTTTASAGDRSSPASSRGSPEVTGNADGQATEGPLSPAGRSAAAAAGLKTPGQAGGGAGGRMPASDVGLETPRRVMFGAPMAAEFNHTSPSNRLTPMPSRDAKVSECCLIMYRVRRRFGYGSAAAALYIRTCTYAAIPCERTSLPFFACEDKPYDFDRSTLYTAVLLSVQY